MFGIASTRESACTKAARAFIARRCALAARFTPMRCGIDTAIAWRMAYWQVWKTWRVWIVSIPLVNRQRERAPHECRGRIALAPADAADRRMGVAADHRNAGPGVFENGGREGRRARTWSAIHPRGAVHTMVVAGAGLLSRPVRG